MRKVTEVYPFKVMDTIKNGLSVYGVNRAYPADAVYCINEMAVEDALFAVESENFIFWTIETGEEKENG